MKDFICPIDERIIIKIEDDFKPIANCTTLEPNSQCKMIEKGCIGCRTDKELLIRSHGDIIEYLQSFSRDFHRNVGSYAEALSQLKK